MKMIFIGDIEELLRIRGENAEGEVERI